MAFEPQPDITPTVPYFKLPEANSISYALVQEYNNRDIYKNNFNSKSCQADNSVVDTMTQFFHWEDNPITQFRSNYETMSATLKDENDVEKDLPIELKVENLGIGETMDCKIINIDSEYPNHFGVYFESGQTYDYGTTNPLSSYELLGRLPEWGVVGNKFYSTHFDEWYDIVDIYYDNSISSDVLVIDNTYLGSGVNDICSSLYNRFNYNVYEFVTPLYDKSDLYCQVNLSNTDTRDDFIDIKYSSEDLLIEEDLDSEKIELVWFNYDNSSDVFYSTKTFGINRLRYVSFTEGSESEKSTEKASNTVIPIASRNYHTKTLSLERVPAMLFRKLSEAFSHEEVFLDRIQYTIEGFESEWVGDTNSYTIEVEMYDAEDGFDPLVDRRYCGDRPIFPDLTGSLNEELNFEL